MIYLKRIIKKLNKYFMNKKRIKYRKIETSILKNITSNNVSKNIKNYLKKTYQTNSQINFWVNKEN